MQNLQERMPINRAEIRKIALKVLNLENRPKTRVNIAFVDDRKIKELNKRFRNIDSPTDVLSFRYAESQNHQSPKLLGEIAISTETVKRNAQRFHSSINKEMRLCLIHGILHLLGFSDGSPKELRLMQRRQREILRLIYEQTKFNRKL